jgi:hypothetical protein
LYLEALNKALPQIGSVLVVQEGQVSPLPLLSLRDAQPQRSVTVGAEPSATPQSAPAEPAQRGREERDTERAR